MVGWLQKKTEKNIVKTQKIIGGKNVSHLVCVTQLSGALRYCQKPNTIQYNLVQKLALNSLNGFSREPKEGTYKKANQHVMMQICAGNVQRKDNRSINKVSGMY